MTPILELAYDYANPFHVADDFRPPEDPMPENKSSSNGSDHSDQPQMEASFSMLVMSIASSAAVALGLTPDPQTHETKSDRHMARFNIDLLVMLKDKTKGQLSPDEERLMTAILSDLQMKFVQLK